jgi:UDP-3-O-[3-hydroxymyristoyl] glucosamine N-acyltransferase
VIDKKRVLVLSPHVDDWVISVNGSARIGKRCFIGTNSTIVQKVSICDDVMVGAGSVVVDDIKEPGKYYGVPAGYQGKWDGEWKT